MRRALRKTSAPRAWTAGVLAGACGLLTSGTATESCGGATEVVVVVDGDLGSDVDAVTVRVDGEGGFTQEKTAELARGVGLPLTLGVHAGGGSRTFEVRAEARRGGDVVVTRRAKARLVDGESRVLVLSLCRACEAVTCGEGQTCGAQGRCVTIPEADLDGWTGTPPPADCRAANASDGGSDALPDVDDTPPIVENSYHTRLDDARLWTKVDLQDMSPSLQNSNFRGWIGAAFDRNRYLYLAPAASEAGAAHGMAVRYDTTQPVDAAASWSALDLTQLRSTAKGFSGVAAISDLFVFFVPYGNGSGDVVARLPIGGAFEDPGAWSFVSVKTQVAGGAGFGGAVVNFSHVWLPTRSPTGFISLHDNRETQNPGRKLDAGWESIDPRGIDLPAASPGGYFGGAFDNDRSILYFAPSTGPSGPHGVALAKQVGGGTTSGWTSFDLTTLSPDHRGYAGGVYTSPWVYFVPNGNGRVARVDSRKTFSDAASWERFDLSTIDPDLGGFLGGVFDGRYVYLVPAQRRARVIVARHDTLSPRAFDDPAAWSTFEVSTLSGPNATFAGGAYDGQYVYLVPAGSGPLMRFKARTDVSMDSLKRANGSFL